PVASPRLSYPLPSCRQPARASGAGAGGAGNGAGGAAAHRLHRRVAARHLSLAMMERVGLIAGSGRFPVLFAETARRRGVGVVAVAHVGETDEALSGVVEAITWVHAGQLEAIIQALKQAGGTRSVLVGGIAKPRLVRAVKPV